MASDILLYNSEVIPVGRDQKQHVEITRDIAERFNRVYGDIFTIPEAMIHDTIALIPGIDGQKMSKSYNNTINIFDKEKDLKKKIMRIVTDSTPVEEPKDPDICNLFSRYKLFTAESETASLRERYEKGGLSYGKVKEELFSLIWDYFEPYRKKREALISDRGEVVNILKKGAEKTRKIAVNTLDIVKKAVGLIYY